MSCSVVGITEGYTVRSENEEDEAKKDEDRRRRSYVADMQNIGENERQ